MQAQVHGDLVSNPTLFFRVKFQLNENTYKSASRQLYEFTLVLVLVRPSSRHPQFLGHVGLYRRSKAPSCFFKLLFWKKATYPVQAFSLAPRLQRGSS